MLPFFTTVYGPLACAGLALVVIASLPGLWRDTAAPRWIDWFRGREGVYAAVLLLGLLLFRWPIFFVQHPLNPDEAQFIVGALTLWEDPIFWRAFDGQTAGPLIYYGLMPLKLFGLLNYTGAKLTACLMVFGTLWFSYRSLRVLVGAGLARLGILPAFCFFAFTVHTEFVHYTSEHAPLLLLAVGLSGLAVVLARENLSPFPTRSWLLAGAAFGAVPFSKLQAVPAAAALLLTAAAWILTRDTLTRRQRWAELGKLSAAVCFVPAGFAVMLTVGGAWENFWYSYFANNLAYLDSSVASPRQTLGSLLPYLTMSWDWCALAAGCLVLTAATLGRLDLRDSRLRWALVAATAFAVASTPFTLFLRRYPHYLLFLVMPLAFLASVALACAWLAPQASALHRRLLAGLLAAGLAAQATVKALEGNPHLSGMSGTSPVVDDVARLILGHATPGDRMAVWGWRGHLHVETGLPQGTSDSNSVSQMTPSALQDYFVARYVRELQRTRPRIFVDAVGPSASAVNFLDRSLYAHEQFPTVAAFIAEHYAQVAELDHARIYVRKTP